MTSEDFPIVKERHRNQVQKFYNDGGDKRILEYDDIHGYILDVGGYQGDWSARMMDRYEVFPIIYEPVDQFYQILIKRFRGDPRVSVMKAGLGAWNEKRVMYVNGNASSAIGGGDIREKVMIQDVAEVVNPVFSDPKKVFIEVMKINIEGMEYELLERMLEKYCHTCIKNITIQFHEFVFNKLIPNARRRMLEIRERLSETHELQYAWDFVWESWKRK